MREFLRSRLTYANVMATIAVFLSLGGAGYAALRVPANSVGSKQLKPGAVTHRKLANGAVTGSKVAANSLTGAQINASTLGTVPKATHASSANIATNLAAPEQFHQIGASGEPGFQHGWTNNGTYEAPAGFYKDREGVVHLTGDVAGSSGSVIFQLPAGYRPAAGKFQSFEEDCSCSAGYTGTVQVGGTGSILGDGAVELVVLGTVVSLDGITFRAES